MGPAGYRVVDFLLALDINSVLLLFLRPVTLNGLY